MQKNAYVRSHLHQIVRLQIRDDDRVVSTERQAARLSQPILVPRQRIDPIPVLLALLPTDSPHGAIIRIGDVDGAVRMNVDPAERGKERATALPVSIPGPIELTGDRRDAKGLRSIVVQERIGFIGFSRGTTFSIIKNHRFLKNCACSDLSAIPTTSSTHDIVSRKAWVLSFAPISGTSLACVER